MRIMHVAWEYPPLVYGGLGRHVHALATAQTRAGHEVHVITQHIADQPAQAVVDGVHVHREARAPKLDFVPDNLLRWVAALDEDLATSALACAAATEIDVVHSHDWMTTGAGVRVARSHHVPLVVTVHATEQGRHQGYLPNQISLAVDATERYLTNEADGVIVCSAAMRQEVINQFQVEPCDVTVIANGIDVDQWQVPAETRAAARKKWAPDRPLIVFSGRIEVEKGIYHLIEAMPRVLSEQPRALLVIAGNGGQVTYVAEAIRNHGLEASVQLAGWLPEAELRGLISAADVAVVPSLYEPFGLVALEAMAMQAPLVAAATGGLADIVTPGHNGLLFTAASRVELAQMILLTLADPRAARARADTAFHELGQRFNWDDIAHTTVQRYQQIIDTNAAPPG